MAPTWPPSASLASMTTPRGETTEVLWSAELDAEVLADDGWAALAASGTDDPATFATYLRTLR